MGQLAQLKLPANEKRPTAQLLQATDPLAPTAAEYVPAAHAVQPGDPVVIANRPLPHTVQTDAPAAE